MLCRCYQPNDFTQDIVLMQTWVIVTVCFVFFFLSFSVSVCLLKLKQPQAQMFRHYRRFTILNSFKLLIISIC